MPHNELDMIDESEGERQEYAAFRNHYYETIWSLPFASYRLYDLCVVQQEYAQRIAEGDDVDNLQRECRIQLLGRLQDATQHQLMHLNVMLYNNMSRFTRLEHDLLMEPRRLVKETRRKRLILNVIAENQREFADVFADEEAPRENEPEAMDEGDEQRDYQQHADRHDDDDDDDEMDEAMEPQQRRDMPRYDVDEPMALLPGYPHPIPFREFALFREILGRILEAEEYIVPEDPVPRDTGINGEMH
ncbi:unnamed protein product [Caenorhabditis bovis]|uniref:Uncharacterized protein n=1 Tax=Caenorhabditis bovis TaxID=2654633 RepID=A0A8S1EP23_9PELO|nr:unnamed protein product [Caenorhabditis bovis]